MGGRKKPKQIVNQPVATETQNLQPFYTATGVAPTNFMKLPSAQRSQIYAGYQYSNTGKGSQDAYTAYQRYLSDYRKNTEKVALQRQIQQLQGKINKTTKPVPGTVNDYQKQQLQVLNQQAKVQQQYYNQQLAESQHQNKLLSQYQKQQSGLFSQYQNQQQGQLNNLVNLQKNYVTQMNQQQTKQANYQQALANKAGVQAQEAMRDDNLGLLDQQKLQAARSRIFAQRRRNPVTSISGNYR